MVVVDMFQPLFVYTLVNTVKVIEPGFREAEGGFIHKTKVCILLPTHCRGQQTAVTQYVL